MNWGIIGPGNIANDFANDLQYVTTRQCSIGPVLGNNPEHTKTFVEKYNGSSVTNTIEEFIHAKPDAVYIATPHPLHHQQTLICLENKIPVLCEKPLAINTQQVFELMVSSKKK